MNQSVDPVGSAIVYQARNLLNGHHYIGFTTKGLDARREQHFKSARVKQARFRFQHAINKYGPENFVFEVMADFEGDEELAKLYECEAIAKYRPEYNLSHGGDGGSLSEETRAKISAANMGRAGTHKGKKFSLETRLKMSLSTRGKPHPWARFKSVTARQKTSASLMGHPNYYKGKAIRCLTDGQVFSSTQEAVNFYGVISYTSITHILKGRKSSVKGLSFSYLENTE